jgi:deoxycytidylate deaminase
LSENILPPEPQRPDLYIALVAAAGTDLTLLKNQLKAQLASFDYKYDEIKISSIISELLDIPCAGVEEDKRIESLMDGGDKVRAAHKSGDGVITLAATAIRAKRQELNDRGLGLVGSTAFIIDSLKNPEEIQTLNKLYGRNFYTISVYASKNDRVTKLANKIAESCNSPSAQIHKDRATTIIEEDEKRNSTKLSQDVLNTFPKADFFVHYKDALSENIERFINIIFGAPFETPSSDEFNMFSAKAASYRSCDLSRQVGAVIVGKNNVLISSGCNDVPYPGGGMFYPGRLDAEDNRDYTVQYDPNYQEISKMLAEILRAFKKAGLLENSISNDEPEALVHRLLHGDWKALILDARVRSLIEFGRVVHAEMHAITEAARVGRSVENAALFCTTFPCHICARHIIAAGITEVVYIEPYPKSMTKSLYEREINTEDSVGTLDGAVRFRPFLGVAPTIYQRVFAMKPRKNEAGTIVQWDKSKAVPLGAVFGVSSLTLEESLSSKVDGILAICKSAKIEIGQSGTKHEQGTTPSPN